MKIAIDVRIPVVSSCCLAEFRTVVENDESYNYCLGCGHECSLEEIDPETQAVKRVESAEEHE